MKIIQGKYRSANLIQMDYKNKSFPFLILLQKKKRKKKKTQFEHADAVIMGGLVYISRRKVVTYQSQWLKINSCNKVCKEVGSVGRLSWFDIEI